MNDNCSFAFIKYHLLYTTVTSGSQSRRDNVNLFPKPLILIKISVNCVSKPSMLRTFCARYFTLLAFCAQTKACAA